MEIKQKNENFTKNTNFFSTNMQFYAFFAKFFFQSVSRKETNF